MIFIAILSFHDAFSTLVKVSGGDPWPDRQASAFAPWLQNKAVVGNLVMPYMQEISSHLDAFDDTFIYRSVPQSLS
jgi:hypothetical protein